MANDTNPGGEDVALSVDQAAAAYVKAIAPKEAPKSQSEDPIDDQGQTDDELQVSPEDAGETTDGETETDGQAEDDQAGAEQDSDQGRFVASNGKVKLPDGSVSTVADLIQGNLRDRDYRQKTMDAAEVKKTAEAQSAAIKERETQLEQNTKYVTDLLKTVIPGPPDPAMLKVDPVAYMEQEVLHKQWMQHLQYLDGQRQQSESARKAEADKSEQEIAQREWDALAKAVPSFKDEAKVKAFGDDVKKYGAGYGFNPEELRRAVLLDHRQALVLRKAIAWDKLQASKTAVAQKVEGRPPVTKGGARSSPQQQRGRAVSDALTRLKSSGTVEDAAAAYLASRKTG